MSRPQLRPAVAPNDRFSGDEQQRRARGYGLAGACLALLVVVVWYQSRFRASEAAVVSRLLTWFTGIHATELAHQPIIWVHAGQPGTFGLKITAECTSALLVIGFLALTVVLALTGGFRQTRLLAALGAAVLVAFAINLVRLAFIAVAASNWGLHSGFTASHVYVGSVITIIGTAAGVAAYLWLLARGGRASANDSNPPAAKT